MASPAFHLLAPLLAGLVPLVACSRADAPAAAPSPALGAFQYRPERVPAGALYHYVKSNRDGSHPGQVYAYVESATRLDVLKLEPSANVSVNILADLNWRTFSAERLEMWYDHPDGAHHRVFSSVDDGIALLLTLDDPRGFNSRVLEIMGSEPRRVPVPSHPAHVYGFELLSLGFTLPHLSDPSQPFSFTLLGDNPRFGPDSPALLANLGEAWMRPGAEETHAGFACRRYAIGGPAFGGQTGDVWVDTEHHHITDLEIPLANNGDWRDFKLALQSVRTLDGAAWQSWKREAIASYLAQRAPER